MDKFTTLTGIAAPLPMVNVDTDMIIPKQFLKTIKRTGLGKALFAEMRYKPDGKLDFAFVLNRMPFREAKILITGANFGCGSSREHAPWALLDFGIRTIIAPSFADIFFTNCLKNGMLPIVMGERDVSEMTREASDGKEFTIDLERRRVIRPNGAPVPFPIDEFARHCLLNGLDDIGLTLEKTAVIDKFEEAQKKTQPWLYPAPTTPPAPPAPAP
jgi:3-isopropylmalate/(R)-2-methylmalate dehydratase small subunit